MITYPLEGALVTDPDRYRYWTVSYFAVYAPTAPFRPLPLRRRDHAAEESRASPHPERKLAAVGQLASSIAHEINNPLESVTNLLYLARLADKLDEARDYLDTAEIELRRAFAITSQTLRFHKQASSPQEVSLTALAESVISIYQGRIANAHVSVEHRWRAQRFLRCFEGEVRQVISNLIGNALDAMPGGGRLLLRDQEGTHRPTGEGGIFLTIADTGEGMSPATRSRLFDPFFTTKGITGTGLGLWVSRQIVGRHQGVLRVRSSQSPQGHGTVFTVFFPFTAIER